MNARRQEREAEETLGGCDARQRGLEGAAFKKGVTLPAKREACALLQRGLR